MDSMTNTDRADSLNIISQENILLSLIKELCSENDDKMSSVLKGKVSRIIADCNLTHYYSLHKTSTTDESTSSLLGVMNLASTELTFDEQAALNQAIIHKIETKIPNFMSELEKLKITCTNAKKCRGDQIAELQEGLDDKMSTLEEQENEKVELMMEWLNYRMSNVTTFSKHLTEQMSLKTKILDLKSKILHLRILQNIFTETNQSIKAYSEVHKDLKDNIKETEERIKKYREIIDNDLD